MLPETISSYLKQHDVPFVAVSHPVAVSATRLAELLGVSGHQVGKTLLVKADEAWLLVLLPATARLDLEAVARVAGAKHAELAPEAELAWRFPQCEVGAAPPFGNIWELPLIADVTLAHPGTLYLRGGTHEDVLEMNFVDLADLEDPLIAAVTDEAVEIAGGELQGASPDEAF
jgi:Ala-tRNA(Pro) deacylase